MAKKGIEDILMLKVEDDESRKLLRTVLSKTKWLDRFSPDEITIEVLEKLYSKITKKYPGRIGYVQPAGDDSWVFMVNHVETGEWINSVYAKGFYEGLAKSIIVLYGHFIKNIPFKRSGHGES